MISSFLSKFKRESKETSAGLAKERLQIIIASSNQNRDFSFIPKLEREILELVKKYVDIENDSVDMKVDIDDATGCKMLELNVSLPDVSDLNVKN